MTGKSVTGWVTTVGGTTLSWKSQKQFTVAQNTAEAEYIAACSVSKECCYLKSLLKELKFPNQITIHTDSTSALSTIQNPVQRQKAKHFNVVYHWVRECHSTGRLKYVYLAGANQPEDMLFKALQQVLLDRHTKSLGFGRLYGTGGVSLFFYFYSGRFRMPCILAGSVFCVSYMQKYTW